MAATPSDLISVVNINENFIIKINKRKMKIYTNKITYIMAVNCQRVLNWHQIIALIYSALIYKSYEILFHGYS